MNRVIIADDHALVRAGFRQLATRDPSFKVVGEASDGQTLLDLIRKTPADLIVLDINMPGPGFRETIRAIRQQFPATQVLVVSMYPEGEIAVAALEAGAAGYVSKARAEPELLAAMTKVSAGGKFVTSSLAEWLVARLESPEIPGTERLSHREESVLKLLADGKSYKEIGAALSMSPKTVSTYRHRVLTKLKLETTADLVRYVVQRNRIP